MVTALDFLAFASEFQRHPTEIFRRASASHAYYAAFHHLREIAEDRVGLPSFGTVDDHRDLLAAIRQLDIEIADELQYLRRVRNLADYELATAISAHDAVTCYDSAVRILSYA